RREPWGPALPVTRRERCCHWTLSRVKEQSSETRSPVSSRVQTISFSSGLRQALASRSASSARRGSRTNWCAISSPAWQRGRFAVGRRSRTRFALFRAGYQAAHGDNSGSRPCFGRPGRRGVGGGNLAEFALLHRKRTCPHRRCQGVGP